MDKKQRKILTESIILDLSSVFGEFIEQATSRSETSKQLFISLKKESLDSYIEHTKEMLAMQIGKYMIEQGFVRYTEWDSFNGDSTITDSTVYTIKPCNLRKFMISIASYIIDGWIKSD